MTSRVSPEASHAAAGAAVVGAAAAGAADDEPIWRACREACQKLHRSWNEAQLATPIKVVLLVSVIVMLVLSSGTWIPLLVTAGIFYGVYRIIRAIVLADGSERAFDLVVAADGYRSLGRRLLFPGRSIEYAGYVAWRGLLDESALESNTLLHERLVGIGLPTGLAIFYLVPGMGGSQVGRRLINWLVYQPVDASELPSYARAGSSIGHVGCLTEHFRTGNGRNRQRFGGPVGRIQFALLVDRLLHVGDYRWRNGRTG